MYGLNRLDHLRALLTAAAPSPTRLLRLNPPLGFFAFTHSSCRRVVELSSPAAVAGIDDFVYVGKGFKICAKDEIEGAICSSRNTYMTKKSQKEKKRKVLLSRNVARLTCESAAGGGICDVYLVGTNHVCPKSRREARDLVKFLKPQVLLLYYYVYLLQVFLLELCPDRVHFLTHQNMKVPTMGEMIDMWHKNEDLFSILYKWFEAKICSCVEIVGRWRVACGI